MPTPDQPVEGRAPPRHVGGDVYTDAARELSERSLNPRQKALDADRDIGSASEDEVDSDAAGDGATPPVDDDSRA